jgi:hypothetical protein
MLWKSRGNLESWRRPEPEGESDGPRDTGIKGHQARNPSSVSRCCHRRHAVWVRDGSTTELRGGDESCGNLAWRLQSAIIIPHGAVCMNQGTCTGMRSLSLDTSSTGAEPTELVCVCAWVVVLQAGQGRTEPLRRDSAPIRNWVDGVDSLEGWFYILYGA